MTQPSKASLHGMGPAIHVSKGDRSTLFWIILVLLAVGAMFLLARTSPQPYELMSVDFGHAGGTM